MKSKLLGIAVILITIAISAAGTYAYFTAETTAHNVITSGGIDIAVVEYQRGADGALTPYPDEKIAVMPGSEVSKVVTVENYDAPAYIRAKIVVTAKFDPSVGEGPSDPGQVITVSYQDGWTQKDPDDGWYYYESAVPAGEATAPFIESVTYKAAEMGNEYQNAEFYIDVYAQAVQCANNGEDALSATGWPQHTPIERIKDALGVLK